MRSALARSLAVALASGLLTTAAHAQPPAQSAQPKSAATPPTHGPEAWSGCCGLAPWPQAGPMTNRRAYGGLLFGGYSSLIGGSLARHNQALKQGVPAPFASMRNPLPATPENARRGQAVYEAHCASCHGETGLGDGQAAKTLTPPPAQLGWLHNLRTSRWDGFMYWSTAAGGAPFKTAMPAFKGQLSDEEIWSVIGYIQARITKTPRRR